MNKAILEWPLPYRLQPPRPREWVDGQGRERASSALIWHSVSMDESLQPCLKRTAVSDLCPWPINSGGVCSDESESSNTDVER